MLSNPRIFYATGITYPSQPVSRQQILHTSQALFENLGKDFTLGAANVTFDNGLYSGPIVNFGKKISIFLAWQQLLFVQKNKFNVVYCREPRLMWAIVLFNKLLRLPLIFIFEAHDVHADWRFHSLIKDMKYVFCVSNGIREDIIKLHPLADVRVLRNGINLKLQITEDKLLLRKKYNLPIEKKIILYLGNIGRYAWKGEDVLLASRQYIDTKDVHVVIAGVSNKDLDEIKNLYENQNTSIIGRLNESEVAEVQSLADIVVLPNKAEDTMSLKYTCPIKMFEYMRSGRPIIASDLPCIKEVLDEDTAFFFESGNHLLLAQTIDYALSVPSIGAQKALKAREKVEQYSWPKKARQIVSSVS